MCLTKCILTFVIEFGLCPIYAHGSYFLPNAAIIIMMMMMITGGSHNLKGSALPADPKIWKNIKNVKMYFVKNMLFLKVSGQMVSIAVFGVFFYIG